MCGIVGAIAQRNVVPFLIEGLGRLEYRGYDSAGIAVLSETEIRRIHSVGRVAEMRQRVDREKLTGFTGVGHTRWATRLPPADSSWIYAQYPGILRTPADYCRCDFSMPLLERLSSTRIIHQAENTIAGAQLVARLTRIARQAGAPAQRNFANGLSGLKPCYGKQLVEIRHPQKFGRDPGRVG